MVGKTTRQLDFYSNMESGRDGGRRITVFPLTWSQHVTTCFPAKKPAAPKECPTNAMQSASVCCITLVEHVYNGMSHMKSNLTIKHKG